MAQYEPIVIHVTIDGVPELQKRFAAIGADFNAALAGGMTASAMGVAQVAAKNAPWLSGTLSKSITVDPERPAETKATLDATGAATVLIKAPVEYAASQEFLWDRLPVGPHKTNKGPFMRPALYNNEKAIVQDIGNALRMVVTKAEAANA